MKFSLTRNKLRKLWEQSKVHFSDLNTKKNDNDRQVLQDNILKNPQVVFDSNWKVVSSQNEFGSTRFKKGDDGLQRMSVDDDFTLDLPEDALPFLETAVILRPPPGTRIRDINSLPIEKFTANHVVLKGDNSLLFQGTPFLSNRIHLQQELDDGNFDGDIAQKVWDGTIEYKDSGGTQFRVVGRIERFTGVQFTGGTPPECDPFLNNIDFTCAPFFIGKHEFTTMSSTSTTFIGTKTTQTFAPTTCTSSEVEVENQTFSVTFSTLDEEQWRIDGVKINKATEQVVETGIITINTQVGDVIEFRGPFEFQGYTIYYSTEKITKINFDLFSGDVNIQFHLSPIPDPNDIGYSSMTLDRNLDSKDFEELITLNIQRPTTQDVTLFLDDVKTFKKFKTIISRFFGLTTPSTVSVTQTFATLKDTYTASGSTYSLVHSHGTNTAEIFEPDSVDIEYRIIASITNPLYWNSIRKYRNTRDAT